jgi:hypothetical protein
VILIPSEISSAQHVLAGDPDKLNNHPVQIWDDSRVRFLADLSKNLLKKPETRSLPDVVTFAYWARKANLKALKTRIINQDRVQTGLGLVFHICPSNVPVNFAFSMAFGLLSGNSCVLRLSSAESQTTTLIAQTVFDLLNDPTHAAMREALLLLRYEHNDAINAFWLSKADGRIVWGGDETVQHMRGFPVPPRSREITFPDRYSLCTLQPDAILCLGDEGLEALCGQLYNDIYLMDQAACSSPQLVAWIGDKDKVNAAQDKLWPRFVAFADERYGIRAVQAMDKLVTACEAAITKPNVKNIKRQGDSLYRIDLDALSVDQDKCRGYSGTVHEVILSSLEDLSPIVTEVYQTLTYFGFDRNDMIEYVSSSSLRGIDRVVPVGQALEMDIFWDGFDIIASLSRIVDIR